MSGTVRNIFIKPFIFEWLKKITEAMHMDWTKISGLITLVVGLLALAYQYLIGHGIVIPGWVATVLSFLVTIFGGATVAAVYKLHSKINTLEMKLGLKK